jgi:hypothetical protein
MKLVRNFKFINDNEPIFWIKKHSSNKILYKTLDNIRIFMGMLMYKIYYDNELNKYSYYNDKRSKEEYMLSVVIYDELINNLINVFTCNSVDVVRYSLRKIIFMDIEKMKNINSGSNIEYIALMRDVASYFCMCFIDY